jgi:pimeloyl-ACP methyl ester carboxylesterase
MPAQVAIIHGWSDTSKSFLGLRDFLAANGYEARQVWLGDYISMEDDVRVEDAARRMHSVVQDLIGKGVLQVPFDLIVHSTGGLVAREWIVSHYPDGQGCPVKRLVMLAPANFGSKLASLGKSMIGRVAKGWNNWFQTGTEMLRALELASPYQWQLARRDLLDADGAGTGPYGAGKVWPFVIVGSRGYSGGMRQIVNENGSDGTVRVAAANLNVSGMTIDFSGGADEPQPRFWASRAGAVQFPLAVLADRDHSTIVHPNADTGSVDGSAAVLGQLVLGALRCQTDDDYGRLYDEWDDISERAAALATDEGGRAALFTKDAPTANALHRHFQMITMVRDEEGRPIEDYFLEFYAPGTAGDGDIVYFQREVLRDVHVNGETGSMRCLFIDRNTLMSGYYGRIRDPAKRRLAVSLSAAAIGKNIRYFDATREGAKGHLTIHEENIDHRRGELSGARLRRNSTHLVEIIVPRRPVDRVFKFSR